jgi:hypothetical protein
VTVKCLDDIQRRFAAWCKLNGRTIQEVLIEFMKMKGDALARFEDQTKKQESSFVNFPDLQIIGRYRHVEAFQRTNLRNIFRPFCIGSAMIR